MLLGRRPPRCRTALRFDVGEAHAGTRCRLRPGHAGPHEGRHLPELPYQKVRWYQGDGREFQSDRDIYYAWKMRK